MMFRDRKHAGELLGQRLSEVIGKYNRTDDGKPLPVVVLGLPRGGVPVAKEVAKALNAPLDILVVRKLGVPGQEELAMGAVASGDAEFLNTNLIESLRIEQAKVDKIRKQQKTEIIKRERLFMRGRPHLNVAGACIVLVDDGLATGATMKAAVQALRGKNPAKIVVAVPVSPADTLREMRGMADHVICLTQPELFYGVGGSYHVFAQTSDEEVVSILEGSIKNLI